MFVIAIKDKKFCLNIESDKVIILFIIIQIRKAGDGVNGSSSESLPEGFGSSPGPRLLFE
ncbi:MAG: hypothetical protein QW303_06115 [Nitrososphaerota archaeon]